MILIIKDLFKKLWPYGVLFTAIAGLSFLLKILFINHIPTEQVFDFATYYELASNIAGGKGHTLGGVPVAWSAPGYSYALAAWMGIFGVSEICGKYFNVLLSTITLLPLFLVYLKIFPAKKLAVAALIVTALFPTYIAYNNVLGTEIFFVFLLSLMLYVQFCLPEKPVFYIISGVLLGALALTKPFMLAYPAVCAGIFWLRHKKLCKTVIYTVIVTVVMLVLVVPWSVRNYRYYGNFTLVSYNAGYVMFINNNDDNTYGGWMDLAKIRKSSELDSELNTVLKNGERSIKEAYDAESPLKKAATEWIGANPLEFIKLGFLRVGQTFFAGANDVSQWARNLVSYTTMSSGMTEAEFLRRENLILLGYNFCMYALGSIGFIFCGAVTWRFVKSFFTNQRRISELTSLVFINIIFFTFVVFFFEGQARYAFPVIIFFIISLVSFVNSCRNF